MVVSQISILARFFQVVHSEYTNSHTGTNDIYGTVQAKASQPWYGQDQTDSKVGVFCLFYFYKCRECTWPFLDLEGSRWTERIGGKWNWTHKSASIVIVFALLNTSVVVLLSLINRPVCLGGMAGRLTCELRVCGGFALLVCTFVAFLQLSCLAHWLCTSGTWATAKQENWLKIVTAVGESWDGLGGVFLGVAQQVRCEGCWCFLWLCGTDLRCPHAPPDPINTSKPVQTPLDCPADSRPCSASQTYNWHRGRKCYRNQLSCQDVVENINESVQVGDLHPVFIQSKLGFMHLGQRTNPLSRSFQGTPCTSTQSMIDYNDVAGDRNRDQAKSSEMCRSLDVT